MSPNKENLHEFYKFFQLAIPALLGKLVEVVFHVACLHGHHNTFSGATFRPRARGWGGL